MLSGEDSYDQVQSHSRSTTGTTSPTRAGSASHLSPINAVSESHTGKPLCMRDALDASMESMRCAMDGDETSENPGDDDCGEPLRMDD